MKHKLRDLPQRVMTDVEKQELLKGLKEHTAYKVLVSYGKNNPMHYAIFFVGYHSGAYCDIYTNIYDRPFKLREVYCIEVLKQLCNLT